VLPLTSRRSAGRRLAQALLGRRGGAPQDCGDQDAPDEEIGAATAQPAPTADDAAARIDAARERLRSRIPAPREDPEP